ncbi:hypothetical protein BDV93DRAFT_509524 [Ceratobasidium sp. AG-I]|nr:hypothetical protein BDV93DRAFT_509524 [Ceratobasidium sp. AG-I]
MFHVHKFKLEEFSELKATIKSDRKHRHIDLPDSPEDFHNMLEVIYSSPCALDLPTFTTNVLFSALRLATRYNHPTLRGFAIRKLELATPSWHEYLPVARECNIPEWEAMALDELTARVETITRAEAHILGLDVFVILAARREAHHSGIIRDIPRQKTTLERRLTQAEEDQKMRGFVIPAKRSARFIQRKQIASFYFNIMVRPDQNASSTRGKTAQKPDR